MEKENTAVGAQRPAGRQLLSKLQKQSRRCLSALSKHLHQPYPPIDPEQSYLLGVRGLLTLQSFTWVFLQTFVPAAVRNTPNAASKPLYETLLRDIFSVLFWNESLIYSAFILLSARTIPIPFLTTSTKTTLASAIFRRGLRLWPPAATTLLIIKLTSSTLAKTPISTFALQTSNPHLTPPHHLPTPLSHLNALFTLFWTTTSPASQAFNTAFPSHTLYTLSLIYAQSYTVYTTMLIIPYTRSPWRVKAYTAFVLTAWWVQSWAWYSITGLALADAVMNMRYRERASRGVSIWRTSRRCPTWIPCAVLMAAGLIMQYLWTAWRPEYENRELKAHTGLYYSGGLNLKIDEKEPQARDDDYLLLLGFFLLLEYSGFLQRIFSNSFLVYLGKRSLSKLLPTVPF